MTNKGSNWNQYWKDTQKAIKAYEYVQKKQAEKYIELIGKKLNEKSVFLEIGAGSGLLARELVKTYNCKGVLVDYSEEAELMFERYNNHPSLEYKRGDAFKIDFGKRFDLVYSDGLIEHFAGEEQEKLIEVHKKAMKENSYLIIFVPKKTILYNIVKKFLKLIGKWNFGFEKPYSKEELETLLKKNGLEPKKFTSAFWEIGTICKIKKKNSQGN